MFTVTPSYVIIVTGCYMLDFGSVMMVGLSGMSFENYVEQILFLKQLESLKEGHLPITGFRSLEGTPLQGQAYDKK